jgi:bacterioferritin (cytochrome b1)
MANNENLKKRVPFIKDDPRINRKGAPKTKLLKDVLTAELQTESNGIDKLTAIINKLTTMAVKGDMNAIKEVLDRYAGKSVQHNIIEEVEKPIFKQIDLDVTSDDSSD